MATCTLEFSQGHYQPIIDGVEDDNDDPLPEQSDPLLNAEQCRKNYHYIVQTIAGFSVQISAKCYTAFPHVFSKQDAMAVLHPLVGLQEFADIHCQYQRNSTSINSSSAWKANFEALRADSGQGSVTESDAIDDAVCWNVIDKLGSFTDSSDVVVARWLSQSDSLQTRNDLWVYVWSELLDVLQSYLSKDANKEEHATSVTPSPGSRKHKAVQQDGVAAFFTLAQMQQMYAYFVGHNTGGTSPNLGNPQGGGCCGGTPGGPHLKCPNPKCKMHHPGGLDKCPHYKETKTIIAESKQKFRKIVEPVPGPAADVQR
eukprot:107135-Rhodomonas_salina.2